jgi:hypothetical protein
MSQSLKDFFKETKEGPLCRTVGISVSIAMEKKIEWLKEEKNFDVNKYLRKQLEILIERAEKGEMDR